MTATRHTNNFDFSELHKRMDWYVNQDLIPFAITAVLKGKEMVDLSFHGKADKEKGRPLNSATILRMHSSTKIACSVAAMMLWEENKFDLDDPINLYLPDFSDMRVLRGDAKDIDDNEPASGPIRINQVMSHTAGFSYGFLEPNSIIDKAYNAARLNPMTSGSTLTLKSLCEELGKLPLVYHPGESWRYSFATDVLAHLIEVISGQTFDQFLRERLFEPLGMIDTDFWVPENKIERLSSMYLPTDPMDPMSAAPNLMDSSANPRNTERPSFLSGGSGLFSTFEDYLRFTRMIIEKGSLNNIQIIKPETLDLMLTNQCAPGVGVSFPVWKMSDTTFGLGFALKNKPARGEPDTASGEFHWGGMGGTHFWWSPNADITGICMTQRMPAFWHPFSRDFKKMVYNIVT